jgi:DNA-binding CsgD family transcriptional regulator
MNQSDTSGTQLGATYTGVFRFLAELQRAKDAESPEKATASYAKALVALRTFSSDVTFANDPFIVRSCLWMTACLANDPEALKVDEWQLPPSGRHRSIAGLAAIVSQLFLGERQNLADLAPVLDAQVDDVIVDAVRIIVRGTVYATRRPGTQREKGAPSAPDALATLRAGGYGTIAALLAALDDKASRLTATGIALTRAETEVLRLMAEGRTPAEIAAVRHNSLNTIQTHQKAIYRKLEVKTASAAIGRGRSLGLL